MTRRDASLDVLRTMGNVAVVVIHAFTVGQYVIGRGVEYRIWQVACLDVFLTALPALFFLSGYLVEGPLTFTVWSQKFVRRLKRLVAPYIVWNLIWLIVYFAAAHFNAHYSERVAALGLNSLRGAVTHCLGILSDPLDAPLWYVRSVFCLFLVYPLFHWMIGGLGVGVLAVLMLGWGLWGGVWGMPLDSHLLPYYAPLMYLCGMMLRRSRFKISVLADYRVALIGGLFILLMQFVGRGFAYSLCLSGGALLFISAALNLSRYLMQSSVWHRLDDCAFFIFAFHFMVCPVLPRLLSRVIDVGGPGALTFLFAVYVLGGLVLCCACWSVGVRFFPRMFRLLNGQM